MTTPAIEIPGYIVGAWDLDPVHSHVGFVARHMMVSKVRGRFDSWLRDDQAARGVLGKG